MSDSNVNPIIQPKEISEFWLTGKWNEPEKNIKTLTVMAASTLAEISNKEKITAYNGFEKGVRAMFPATAEEKARHQKYQANN